MINQQYTSFNQPHRGSVNKREKFRCQIREKQVNNMIKNLRRKYLIFKDPMNYEVLKNIDLIHCIRQLMEADYYPHKSIDDMFLYASSRQSDHLYELFDERVLQKLVCMAIDRESEKLQYNKKVMWILTNYTAYSSQEIPINYILVLETLAIYNQIDCQPRKFDHCLIEFIALSAANIMFGESRCRNFTQNHSNLLRILISCFMCISPFLLQLYQKQSQIPILLKYFLQLLDNLSSAIDLTDLQSSDTIKAIAQTLIDIIHQIFFKQKNNDHDIQANLNTALNIIKSIIRDSSHPISIVVSLSSQILSLSSDFEDYLLKNISSPQCARTITTFFKILQSIYNIDITNCEDEEIEDSCQQFFIDLFKQHVMSMCETIFKNNNLPLVLVALNLLQDICLEEQLCEILLQENIFLLAEIFRFIMHQNSTFYHKQSAITCIINLLKSTLYNGCDAGHFTFQLISGNKFYCYLYDFLWEYADTDLNILIIEGIYVIIEYEKGLGSFCTKFFLMKGLKQKLMKICDETGSSVLIQKSSQLLNAIEEIESLDEDF